MEKFVVLTRGRTGSTPLVADIDQHLFVECHQEVFRSEPAVSPQDKALSFVGESAQSPGLTAAEYISGLASKTRQGTKAVGFKLLMSQIDERLTSGILEHLMSGQLLVVFLTRDPLRSAISAAIAKSRNAYNWHRDTKDDGYRDRLNTKVYVDPEFVKTEASYYEYWADKWLSDLEAASTPHIHVAYEDYETDRLALVNRVFAFVGADELPSLDINPYSKVTTGEIWDNVTNPEEIRALLAR